MRYLSVLLALMSSIEFFPADCVQCLLHFGVCRFDLKRMCNDRLVVAIFSVKCWCCVRLLSSVVGIRERCLIWTNSDLA